MGYVQKQSSQQASTPAGYVSEQELQVDATGYCLAAGHGPVLQPNSNNAVEYSTSSKEAGGRQCSLVPSHGLSLGNGSDKLQLQLPTAKTQAQLSNIHSAKHLSDGDAVLPAMQCHAALGDMLPYDPLGGDKKTSQGHAYSGIDEKPAHGRPAATCNVPCSATTRQGPGVAEPSLAHALRCSAQHVAVSDKLSMLVA
jgi:hypothetical protein